VVVAALGGAEAPRAAGFAACGGAFAATAATRKKIGSGWKDSVTAGPGQDGVRLGGRAARSRGAGARTARTDVLGRARIGSRSCSDDPLWVDAT